MFASLRRMAQEGYHGLDLTMQVIRLPRESHGLLQRCLSSVVAAGEAQHPTQLPQCFAKVHVVSQLAGQIARSMVVLSCLTMGKDSLSPIPRQKTIAERSRPIFPFHEVASQLGFAAVPAPLG